MCNFKFFKRTLKTVLHSFCAFLGRCVHKYSSSFVLMDNLCLMLEGGTTYKPYVTSLLKDINSFENENLPPHFIKDLDLCFKHILHANPKTGRHITVPYGKGFFSPDFYLYCLKFRAPALLPSHPFPSSDQVHRSWVPPTPPKPKVALVSWVSLVVDKRLPGCPALSRTHDFSPLPLLYANWRGPFLPGLRSLRDIPASIP